MPIMQQSWVDYIQSPDEINQLVIDLSIAFDNATPYNVDSATFASSVMRSEGLVTNGNNDTFGDLDLDRVQGIIDTVVPIFVGQGSDSVNPDLTAEQVATTQFIDPDIGL